MLEFWFDPKVSVIRKFILLLMVMAVTTILYVLQPLALNHILMFMGTGLIFLICRYSKIHFTSAKPHGVLARLLHWTPIALLLTLVFIQLKQGDILIFGAQGIGFMAIAVCIFSPLSLLKKVQDHA